MWGRAQVVMGVSGAQSCLRNFFSLRMGTTRVLLVLQHHGEGGITVCISPEPPVAIFPSLTTVISLSSLQNH